MSRGFHAFFRQYYNLRALLRRADPGAGAAAAGRGLPPRAGRRARRLLRQDPADAAAQHGGLRRPEPVVRPPRPGPGRRARGAGAAGRRTSRRRSPPTTGRARRRSWTGCASPPEPGTWPWRSSRAASSPRRTTSPPASWSACSTPTSSARPKGCCSTCPGTTTTRRCGRRSRPTCSSSGVTVRTGESVPRIALAADGVRVELGGDARQPRARWCWPPIRPRRARSCWTPAWATPRSRGAPGWTRWRTAPPFAVWRLWFDRRVDAARPPFLGTSGFGPLDNVTVLERFEAGAGALVARARRVGGRAARVRAAGAGRRGRGPGPATVRARHGLSRARGAEVVAEEWLLSQDCPLSSPAPWLDRLTVGTPDRRVVLAGDGIRCDYPVALMERAATTGFLAANQLLADLGRRRARPVDRTDAESAPAPWPSPAAIGLPLTLSACAVSHVYVGNPQFTYQIWWVEVNGSHVYVGNQPSALGPTERGGTNRARGTNRGSGAAGGAVSRGTRRAGAGRSGARRSPGRRPRASWPYAGCRAAGPEPSSAPPGSRGGRSRRWWPR